MNRRVFLGALASSAAVRSIAQSETSVPAQTNAASEKKSLTRTPLVLMAPREDGCEAIWGVNQLSKGRIEWESEDGTRGIIGVDRFGFVPQSGDVLKVRVEGLKAGRKYRVRAVTSETAAIAPGSVSAREEASDWKTFRPLNTSAASTKFVVWNDTHVNNETIQKLDETTPAGDFLFWNGDTCNDWKTPEILVPTLLNPGQRDITKERPLFISCGNHDSRGQHAFEMPRVVATPNNRPFYAFRSGPVAAICLHTGEDKPDDHFSFGGRVAFDALRREQADWLADVIRQPGFRDAPYRIVFCHIPLRWTTEEVPDYAKGGFDHVSLRSREMWHRALVDWKTQLIISGHTHRNALIEANEQFPYAQVTGGGPAPKAATWMLAEADGKEFNLAVRGLDGATRHEFKLRPLV